MVLRGSVVKIPAKNVTLKQLADELGYELKYSRNYDYFKMKYEGYFYSGKSFYRIIVYKKELQFVVFCHVNIYKATAQHMITEQNGILIVMEEIIKMAINKLINK